MISLNEIKEKFEKRKITFYEVQLSVDTLRSGIKFSDINSFSEFVDKQKIDVVFCDLYYDNPNDYIITEDMIQRNVLRYMEFDIMDIIIKDIEKNNQNVMKIDFNRPSAILVACIFNSKFCYVYIEDEDIDDNVLIEAKEKLQEIINNKKTYIENRKIENEKIVEELKVKLK